MKIEPIKVNSLPVLSVRALAMYSAMKCRHRMLHGYEINDEYAAKGAEGQLLRSESEFVEMSVYMPIRKKESIVAYLFGSVDEMIVANDSITLVEHKNCQKPPSEWFIDATKSQLGMYLALADHMTAYATSKFHVNNGNPMQKIERNNRPLKATAVMFDYIVFDILSCDTKLLLQYMTEKCLSVIDCWDTASVFDGTYKAKELALIADMMFVEISHVA
jgi:predicted house-cleaning NTP pyrophosphatase (Maf/HAM1 superfamily)